MALNLAEQAALLMLKDNGAFLDSYSESHGFDLAGIVLADLAFADKVRLDQKQNLVIINDMPTGDPILDAALMRLKAAKPTGTSAEWPKRIGSDFANVLLGNLVQRGVLQKQDQGGIFKSTRYPLANPAVKQAVRERLRAALFGGVNPDPQTAALIVILNETGGFDESTVSKKEQKACDKRFAELQPSWEEASVRIEGVAQEVADTISEIVFGIATGHVDFNLPTRR